MLGSCFRWARHLAEASLPTRRTRWGIMAALAASVHHATPGRQRWSPGARLCGSRWAGCSLPLRHAARVVSAEVSPVPSKGPMVWPLQVCAHTCVTSPPAARCPPPDESSPPGESPRPALSLRDGTPEPCALMAPLLPVCPAEALGAGLLAGRWPAAGTQSLWSFSVQRGDLGLGPGARALREKRSVTPTAPWFSHHSPWRSCDAPRGIHPEHQAACFCGQAIRDFPRGGSSTL